MDTYWAREYGTGDKKNAIELVRAADAQRAIDALQAQLQQVEQANARLREALQPFAERWEYFERTKHPSGAPWPEHLEYADDEPSAIYLGQLKAAQQALAELEREGANE